MDLRLLLFSSDNVGLIIKLGYDPNRKEYSLTNNPVHAWPINHSLRADER